MTDSGSALPSIRTASPTVPIAGGSSQDREQCEEGAEGKILENWKNSSQAKGCLFFFNVLTVIVKTVGKALLFMSYVIVFVSSSSLLPVNKKHPISNVSSTSATQMRRERRA